MKRSETALNIRVYVTENKRRIGTLFLLGEHAFLLVITRNHCNSHSVCKVTEFFSDYGVFAEIWGQRLQEIPKPVFEGFR